MDRLEVLILKVGLVIRGTIGFKQLFSLSLSRSFWKNSLFERRGNW